jgi:beta-N-acetylhexosaminidase
VARGAAASFAAGADILLICKDQNSVLESIQILKKKMIHGEIPLKRLQRSVERIMKTKSRFLKNQKKVSPEEVRAYFAL